MAGPLIQNFSVPAGDGFVVNFDIDPDEGLTLDDCDIEWKAYIQQHAVPDPDSDPVITKTKGSGIDVVNSGQLKFKLTLAEADTLELLGNYYHEVTIIDDDGARTTPTIGTMTVTQTENRD